MIRTAKLLCAAAALCASSSAFAQASGWSISEADGQVSVLRDGKAIYGSSGTQLEVGDVVKTSKSASAVLVRGDDFFVVHSNKRVRIKRVAKQGPVSQFFEYVGNLVAPDDGHATLNRPYEAAVVKGVDEGMGLTDSSATAAENPADD